MDLKWHHGNGIKIPSTVPWYSNEAASTLFLSKTSAPTLVDASIRGPCYFSYLHRKRASFHCSLFRHLVDFATRTTTGSLMPGVGNNMSVPNLAWQWEPAFLGAQIPQSLRLFLRVHKYIEWKEPRYSHSYLFDCILCCFDLQPTLQLLVWSDLLSVVVTCKNWTLFSSPLLCTYSAWEMAFSVLWFSQTIHKRVGR